MDGILRGFPKFLDTQVLFNPFEEQFHVPPAAVKLGDCLGRGRQIVGQEDVFGTILGVYSYCLS